jgi:hypothetical protein
VTVPLLAMATVYIMHTRICIRIYTCTYTHAYVYAHIHAHTHTHIYMHIHTRIFTHLDQSATLPLLAMATVRLAVSASFMPRT